MVDLDSIARAVSEATGRPVAAARAQRVGGGDINRAYRVESADRAWFVKLNAPERRPMFEAEAAGLAEIARSRTLRVPEPLGCGADAAASWIVMELIEFGPPRATGMGELGRGLARMHRVTATEFGWDRDNTIGATPQVNTPAADWIAFWRERRLARQLELAARNGHSGRLQERGRLLMERLPALFDGYAPRPSLLHGDLWGGNAGFDRDGAPVVYDPAVYYGDREADLAMTELFGGFGADFHAAYRREFPLDSGYSRRRDLYNLYHVLNHLNLFGGGYGVQAGRMIERLLTASRS